ncbi:50S ribosomal protein L33 [Staphylococcus hominis]|uniref:50S ribosomal protein L33 n=1 Tax=Staphylococcus hominis TaxID=1290 RepID=UPI0039BF7413
MKFEACKLRFTCTECGDRNYITTKNKINNPERIEMKKNCSLDNKQTLNRETK